jgi:hypothetical protein
VDTGARETCFVGYFVLCFSNRNDTIERERKIDGSGRRAEKYRIKVFQKRKRKADGKISLRREQGHFILVIRNRTNSM